MLGMLKERLTDLYLLQRKPVRMVDCNINLSSCVESKVCVGETFPEHIIAQISLRSPYVYPHDYYVYRRDYVMW